MHVYRWDLDRTYLDTPIHSVRGLIRTALENAGEKRNVPGAAALMRALVDRAPDCRVQVLSGSPTQLRPVLEEKLALDGVRVDELVLKDNLGHLRRGRLRAVRDQLGYKLPRLLQSRVGLPAHVGETLFGDDSEADALIYAAYAAAVAGRLDEDGLAHLLEAGGAYPDAVARSVRALRRIERADAVEDIFIRVDRGVPLASHRRLGGAVIPVFGWAQAALVLHRRGRVDDLGLERVLLACMEEGRLSPRRMAGHVQDAVRRGLTEPGHAQAALGASSALAPLAEAVARSLERLGAPPLAASAADSPDWLALLRAG